ncbi:T9SS type A sorting domain-containing protein, partial [bacterium]|nr:T9SS type A sorting domain-containing protein [bacterium]
TEQIIDDSAGNNDVRPDPGETVDLLLTIENANASIGATNVDITLTTDDEDITITTAMNSFASIPANSSVNNNASPLQFDVSPTAEPHEAAFTLTLYDAGNDLTLTEEFTQMIGRPDVLIVDDDGGSNFQIWYQQDLDAMDVVHDTWDVAASGEISTEEFELYTRIIWHTSNQTDPLSVDDQTLIENLLMNNGRLFLVGENIDEQLAGTDFYANVLHAASGTGSTIPQVGGIEGNSITNGFTLLLAGAGGGGNSFSASIIEPFNGSELIFEYLNFATGAGISWEHELGKLIYLSFCFEAVSGVSPTTRATAMTSIFEWFDEPPGVRTSPLEAIPEVYSLEQNYPNPFNPTTEIAFNLPAASNVELTVYDTMGRSVATLFSGNLNAGRHLVTFDASHLASGIYFYRIDADGFSDLEKMALLK